MFWWKLFDYAADLLKFAEYFMRKSLTRSAISSSPRSEKAKIETISFENFSFSPQICRLNGYLLSTMFILELSFPSRLTPYPAPDASPSLDEKQFRFTNKNHNFLWSQKSTRVCDDDGSMFAERSTLIFYWRATLLRSSEDCFKIRSFSQSKLLKSLKVCWMISVEGSTLFPIGKRS